MSRKSNSPASYQDVKYIMDLAVEKPNLKYILSTHGKAIHFKQRCNKYRNLMREMAQEMVDNIPGYRAETSYDILVISQIDDEGNPSRTGKTLIFRHHEPEGTLIDPDTGEEIKLDISIPPILTE